MSSNAVVRNGGSDYADWPRFVGYDFNKHGYLQYTDFEGNDIESPHLLMRSSSTGTRPAYLDENSRGFGTDSLPVLPLTPARRPESYWCGHNAPGQLVGLGVRAVSSMPNCSIEMRLGRYRYPTSTERSEAADRIMLLARETDGVKHYHHWGMGDIPETRGMISYLLHSIPVNYLQPDWATHLYASPHDLALHRSPAYKLQDHVYIIVFSIDAEYTGLWLACAETLLADFASHADHQLVYLLEAIESMKRDVAKGKKIVRVYVGSGGSGVVNATARYRDHFTTAYPDSLIKAMLNINLLVNDILEEDGVDYRIRVFRSIVGSADLIPSVSFSADQIGLLETLVSCLLGSAVVLQGANVQSCGRLPSPLYLSHMVKHLPADLSIESLLDTPTPGVNPYLPRSLAMIVTASAFRAHVELPNSISTILDLVKYLATRPNAIPSSALVPNGDANDDLQRAQAEVAAARTIERTGLEGDELDELEAKYEREDRQQEDRIALQRRFTRSTVPILPTFDYSTLRLDAGAGGSVMDQLAALGLALHIDSNKLLTRRCDECGLGFLTDESLRRHSRSIHGPFEFACDVAGCTASFKTADGLGQHSLVHSDFYYMCGQCDYRTARPGDLKRHATIYLAVRRYACPLEDCETTVHTITELNKHMKRHH